MAHKLGNRMQMTFLPPVINDYVSPDDPVRVYDCFVSALDFQALGIPIESCKAGADEYYPRDMLKLIIYGYSYGIRSSRKLERACLHNLSFIWLMGGLTPDYRTIARFRSEHKEAIKEVLKQCARLCLKLGLIEGNILFTDGSSFRANASIKKTWTKERCEKHLKKISQQIDTLVEESERIDRQEDNKESLVKLKEELRDKERLQKEIQEIASELNETKKRSVNTTDADCTKVKSRQGIHAGYNVQLTVDAKHGLDEYICPEGNRLKYQKSFHDKTKPSQQASEACRIRIYHAEAGDCQRCYHFGICTSAAGGRGVTRHEQEELKEHLEKTYRSQEGQEIYKLRKQKVELPFGHMKRNLQAGQFMLRGKAGTDAEVSILSTCFNIARMITLIGIPGLILRLNGT